MCRSLTSVQAETGLPPGWEVRTSKSKGLPYYFNTKTTESRWDSPEGTDPEKLKLFMANYHSTKAGDAVSGGSNDAIRAAHLLVKHEGSRRPSSWREAKITRSKDEAMEILKGYEQRIKSGETTLAELAVTESDCSSARKGGDL